MLKNGLYDLVLDSTVGKSITEIYGHYKSFSILMLEIFIFVNLDDDSAAISKKCQYFLDRGSGVTAEAHRNILARCVCTQTLIRII